MTSARDADPEPSGVLVLDKPSGPTSHDVVARVRRALGTRRVGHGGTLDPMASGVLVVLVGEATKLASYLTAQDKRYQARVALGSATATLDAEGAVTAQGELAPPLVSDLEALAAASTGREPSAPLTPAPGGALEAALAAERARLEQVPPAFSAIQVEGQRSYDRARRGEEIDLAPRPVRVAALELTGAALAGSTWTIDLSIEVSKGYYVRSLARDLGGRLGVPAHLAALRRTASGPFDLSRALPPDADPPRLAAALVPVAAAAALALPVAQLTSRGVERARCGKALEPDDFAAAPPEEVAAWVDASGRLVAVGGPDGGHQRVRRGFVDG